MSQKAWVVVVALALAYSIQCTMAYRGAMPKAELRDFRRELNLLLFPHLLPAHELMAKVEKASGGHMGSPLEYLVPPKDGIVYSFFGLKNLTEGEFLFCTAKHNASETDLIDGAYTEKGKCVVYCASKMRGMWRKDDFAGHLVLWQRFSEVILQDYPNLDPKLTQVAELGDKCLKDQTENRCQRFYNMANCLWETDIEHEFGHVPQVGEEDYYDK